LEDWGRGRGGVLPGLQHQEQEQPMSVTYGRNVPRAQLLSRNAISDRREIEQARLTFSCSYTDRKLPRYPNISKAYTEKASQNH